MKNNRKKVTFDWKYGLYANIYFLAFVPMLLFFKNSISLALAISIILILFLLMFFHLFEKKHDAYKSKNRDYFKSAYITCSVFFAVGELILIFNYQTSQNLLLLFIYGIFWVFIRDGFSSEKL
ncbi:MAG: hypothetical protein ABF536_07265 [Liquorilactobacillus mali]|uniref:hypothetical protein n=1 Tax=Liquorilactobacillus mali TaxID=1618 RepID=UPI0039E7C4CA